MTRCRRWRALPSSCLLVFASSREPEESGAPDLVRGDEGGTDAGVVAPRFFCFRPQAPGAARPRCLATRHKARRAVALAALRAGSSPHASLVAPHPPLPPIPAPALSRGWTGGGLVALIVPPACGRGARLGGLPPSRSGVGLLGLVAPPQPRAGGRGD